MSLYERAVAFTEGGPFDEQTQLLEDCLDANSNEALAAVQLMAKDMYGGVTYNFYPKVQAAFSLIYWGEKGLEALYQNAVECPKTKNISLALQILSALSARQKLPDMQTWVKSPELVQRILNSVKDWDSLFASSVRYLRKYVLSFESDEDLSLSLGLNFMRSAMTGGVEASKQIFIALSARWLALNESTISAYRALIDSNSDNEPAFQEFFENHPQLLDPMIFQVWPQPDMHGYKTPDFVLRRIDNSYMIVEIETPAKSLVTAAGQITADVQHAISQVTQYRQFLLGRIIEAEKYFPLFTDPECLVVIGRENILSPEQKTVLKLQNQHFHGLKVVGFDWVADRAETVIMNVVENLVDKRRIRLV